MTTPIAADVAAYLGQPGDTRLTDLAATHPPMVTEMVRAYVRDRGFDEAGEPGDDLAAVIVAATARLTSNPHQVTEESLGAFSVRRGTFHGWTLPELAILHRYRKRAM